MSSPVTLADLVERAASIEAELLGLAEVPPLDLVAGRRRQSGQVVTPGIPLSGEVLATTWLGPGAPDLLVEVDDAGRESLVVLVVSDVPSDWRLVCVPDRSARGIVAAFGLALAAAYEGRGRLVDNDLRLAEAADVPDGDPAAFVAATRLVSGAASVQEACVAYLRQFPHLGGWPAA